MKYFQPTLIAAALMAACVSAQAETVTSRSGHHASVSSAFAPHIQCFIHKLDASGYRIDFMTGYAARGNASAHPTGNAIDINQIAFGKVTRRFPSNYNSMAESCGVYSGAGFGDYGHFEMPHKYGYVNLGGHYARNHRSGNIAYSDASFGNSSRADVHY
jgi:hypothetical protein